MKELLETGVGLMGAGMGTVFVLLSMLVLIIQSISKVSRWLGPKTSPAPVSQVAHTPPAGAPAADNELATVIGAAVDAYRRHNNPNE
jgi:sodium pump decarboxylase gamma subunit